MSELRLKRRAAALELSELREKEAAKEASVARDALEEARDLPRSPSPAPPPERIHLLGPLDDPRAPPDLFRPQALVRLEERTAHEARTAAAREAALQSDLAAVRAAQAAAALPPQPPPRASFP